MTQKRKAKQNLSLANKSGILGMALLLVMVCFAALAFGSTSLGIGEVWAWLSGAAEGQTAGIILRYVRLPRVLAAVLAGVGLSVAGVLLQSVTANDMAAPNIIGVNAGAGFCCILLLNFFPLAAKWLPLAAFLGAFGATLLIVGIASRVGTTKVTVILAGIACTSVLNAGISLLSLMDSDVLSAYNAFSVGGLAGIRIEQLYIPAVIIAAGLSCSLVFARRIQLLSLGDALASGLGVHVAGLRMVSLMCASACAAAVVSFAGLLGFVGLVVPHIARKLGAATIRWQLIVSAFVGGVLVVSADLLGRVLLAPTEIPVGILLALIGAPFFVWLLLKRRGTHAELG